MELWWLPSVIVFGGTTIAIVVIAKTLTKRNRLTQQHTRGPIGPLRAPLTDLERDAGVALVRADDALADARDELGFAAAQFGDQATEEFREAVQQAESKLRAAFRLRQQLDDDVPESPARRRDLSLRIISHCGGIQESLARHSSTFVRQRRTEADAPRRWEELRERAHTLHEQSERSQRAVESARTDFDATVLNDASSALADAQRYREAAQAALADADTSIRRGTPAGETLARADEALAHASRALDNVTAILLDLQDQRAQLAEAAERLRAMQQPARDTQLSASDQEFAARIASSLDEAHSTLETLAERGGPAASPDPARDLRAIMTAIDRLDGALAASRTQEARLAGARSALEGALRVAHSQVDSARRVVDGHRRQLGASARTRLAEAERQLQIAQDLPDPVEALDTARRASRLAEDAVALAHFEMR